MISNQSQRKKKQKTKNKWAGYIDPYHPEGGATHQYYRPKDPTLHSGHVIRKCEQCVSSLQWRNPILSNIKVNWSNCLNEIPCSSEKKNKQTQKQKTNLYSEKDKKRRRQGA